MRSSAAFLLLAAAAAWAASAPAPASAQTTEETYRLRADRLEGSLRGEENIYIAIRPVLTHGRTTVTGDSGIVYRTRELVNFRGNVKVVDGGTTMLGNEATYDRKTRLATLRGNVRITEGGSRITGREAFFYRDRNLSVIVGTPRLVDSTRTLTGDRIEYDRNTDQALALGHVVAVDEAESTRVTAGRIRYDRRADYAWADMAPKLELTEAGGVVTTVTADSLEFDNARDRVFGKGTVVVRRQDLTATAGRAAFYRSENRALLLDSPRAWDPQGSATGDTLDIRFVQNRIASIQARPHGRVTYEARADSGRGERTNASGDTITLFLQDDEAREAVIVGSATSFYWPASRDSAQGGRNASSGDTIIVEFDGGRPVRATVIGRAEGTYYMAAEGDTTGAEARERILYRGQRIVYDLRENTVVIREAADVTYRDVRLRARQIQFDADTQRMRAEGNPVLNDGREQIVGETMIYDLAIRRGTVLEARTKYEQGYVTGERVRRVSDDILDVESGTYTTCDLPEPHFHFSADKMKILLHDKVVAKPIIFHIRKIPVLALPFFIFPIRSERHSGFQLPHLEIGSSSASGKFVRNVGYYWAINDHLDATGWGDYYQDERWVAHGQTRYHKRYHYHGELNGSYENRFATGSNRWDFVGTHFQTLDRNLTLTGRANLTNASDYRNDPFLGRSVLVRIQRILRSNLGLSKVWSGVSLNAGAERYQDLDPDPLGLRVQQQLPSARLRVSQRPIGRLARPGVSARLPWLAGTTYSYEASLLGQRNVRVNRYASRDQMRDSLVDQRTGMRHDVSLVDNRGALGVIRISPSLHASGVYYSRDDAGDRHRVGASWRAAVGANTAIFGTTTRGIGPLRALRHVITPNVTFSYQPPIRNLTFVDTAGVRRSRFTGITGIGLSSFEQRFLTFELKNDVHVKVGSAERPTTINNLVQLRSFATYDLLAERSGRRPLSDITSTLLLRPIERSQFSFNFVHSPDNGELLHMGASTGFTLQGESRAAMDSIQAMSDEPGEAAVREGNYLEPQGLVSSGLPWNVSVSIGYAGSRDVNPLSPTHRRWIANATLNGALGINLSRNWRFDYSAQYNARDRLARGNLVSQFLTVKRDLHCWEAQFTRSISGDITEYYFKINVKLLPEVYYEEGSRGLRGFGGIQNLY